MKIKMTLFLIVSFMTGLCVVQAAEMPGQADFSADMSMKYDGQFMQGRLYVSNGKSRMENPASIIIARPDLRVSWILMPQQNMYMEQPIDPRRAPKTSREMPGETERTLIGTESVDGKQAKKFKITYLENGIQAQAYQWLTDDVPIPVKMEALDGSWSTEYRNVHVGAQPDVIFEVPPDYQKMTMPNVADMMNQALQGSQ